MRDAAFIAAQAWASAHAIHELDPVAFGAKVAQAYLAAQAAQHHAGDERVTAEPDPAPVESTPQTLTDGAARPIIATRLHSSGDVVLSIGDEELYLVEKEACVLRSVLIALADRSPSRIGRGSE